MIDIPANLSPEKWYNYSGKFKEIVMKNPIFIAYATHDLEDVLSHYQDKTGRDARAVVVRPNFRFRNDELDHPLVIRTRFAAANVIMVTHLATSEQLADWGRADSQAHEKAMRALMPKYPEKLFEESPSSDVVPKRKPGRPSQRGGTCPHCKNEITNFEDLGFWWGWDKGIAPPYWEDLRSYVFARDDHTCQSCKQRLKKKLLVCHHIIPKEKDGADSARNLLTLCHPCHLDEHPIFQDDE